MTLPEPVVVSAEHPAHQSSPRTGGPIDTIIVHSMQGTMAGTEATFAASDAHASAHYGISKTGQIVRYLNENRTAWHAGNWPVNARSIGIELEATCTEAGGPGDVAQFTPAMLLSLAALVGDLCNRYAIPQSRGIPGIAMHRDVPDPTHPGLFGGVGHHFDPGPSFAGLLDQVVAVVVAAQGRALLPVV